MFKNRIGRRNFLEQVGAGVCAGGILPGVVVADEKPARKRIKIGQIGVGHGHASKLSVYRASPDYEVVGIVEPDDALRKKAASLPPYRDLKWLTRQQLLETPGLQALLVETRVRGLLENAEACVVADMHVHLDKPAGESLPWLKRILDIAAKKKLLVQMVTLSVRDLDRLPALLFLALRLFVLPAIEKSELKSEAKLGG